MQSARVYAGYPSSVMPMIREHNCELAIAKRLVLTDDPVDGEEAVRAFLERRPPKFTGS